MATSNIEVKFYDFEEATGALIVAFKDATDSSVDIDKQPRIAYQPTMFGTTDAVEVAKHIAKLGLYVVDEQKKKDALLADDVAVTAFKALAGQTKQYTLADLGIQDETVQI